MKFKVLQENLRKILWDRIEAGELTGLHLAQHGGRPDQRFQRIEIVLHVRERIGAEALQQLDGAAPRDAVIGEVRYADDREENGNSKEQERRQDAGLEPEVFPDGIDHAARLGEAAS